MITGKTYFTVSHFEKEYCFSMDVSGIAIGIFLFQTNKETKLEIPIVFASRTLLHAETRPPNENYL